MLNVSNRRRATRKARRRALKSERGQAVLRKGDRFFVMDCPVSMLSMYDVCRKVGVELVEFVHPVKL